MKCEYCAGTGDSDNAGKRCFMCNGTGSMCDICGDAVDEPGTDICEQCQAEDDDNE